MAQREIDKFNEINEENLQLFAPTYVVRQEKNGAFELRQTRLTFHYVFVRGTLETVKALCCRSNGFSFLINRSSTARYAVIPDVEMEQFKNIARAYQNCLPYFSLEDIDLEDGDVVEVINGDFPGLIGTYMPRAKSKSGNIILQVYSTLGTVAYNIKATDVRVLEFSKNSTRANDQIDAFVPHLLAALRHYHSDEPIPGALVARLNIFCQRMEIAKVGNQKLEAKLQALLATANHILGNQSAAQSYLAKYDKIKGAITNIWTATLVTLLHAVMNRESRGIPNGPSQPAMSKSQRRLLEELAYYKTCDRCR